MTRLSSGAAFRWSAALGFLGVALGAFGAHFLKDALARHHANATWETAVFYHLVHAVVMLVVAGLRPLPSRAWSAFCLGVLCFSGSLYVYSLTRIYWLVFVTPFGGLCLLVGWFLLAWRPAAVRDHLAAPL